MAVEHVHVYRGFSVRGRRWYWRRRSANGRVIAIGGEGYHNLSDCLNMAHHVNGSDVRYIVEGSD